MAAMITPTTTKTGVSWAMRDVDPCSGKGVDEAVEDVLVAVSADAGVESLQSSEFVGEPRVLDAVRLVVSREVVVEAVVIVAVSGTSRGSGVGVGFKACASTPPGGYGHQ
jgi:hypothetical protein